MSKHKKKPKVRLRYAGWWLRAGAATIDAAIVGLASIAFFAAVFFSHMAPKELEKLWTDLALTLSDAGATQGDLSLFVFACCSGLYLALWTLDAFLVIGWILILYQTSATTSTDLVLQSIPVAANYLYHALMEASAQQATIGKLALGLEVCDTNGNRISFARATVRHFSKTISTLVLMLGWLMPVMSNKKQALHDRFSGCCVIRIPEEKA